MTNEERISQQRLDLLLGELEAIKRLIKRFEGIQPFDLNKTDVLYLSEQKNKKKSIETAIASLRKAKRRKATAAFMLS